MWTEGTKAGKAYSELKQNGFTELFVAAANCVCVRASFGDGQSDG